MLAIAVAFAVIFGKECFGGTGMNIWNPALLTRAFLFFSTGSNWDTELDQELKNSGHLLSHNNGKTTTTILDPAQQWTIDRIVNVLRGLS